MKYLVPQTGTRQVVTGLSLAGILIGIASPVLTTVWSEYYLKSPTPIAVEIPGALLVPLSLMSLFFALFISEKPAFSKKTHKANSK